MASTGSITHARAALAALDVLAEHDPTTPLTDAQRTTLAAWPGWGPLAPAFDPTPEGTWEQISVQLMEHLDDDAYRDAVESVDNSFYTPPVVVDAVWELLARAGFTGGRVLEPGCGSGRFMDRVPEGVGVRFVGVERDRTAARIAALLHPEAEIIHGRLEKSVIPKGLDAVVGNVPFSSQRVFDGTELGRVALHNYFIARSLTALREGGYLVVVTSRFAMDSPPTAGSLMGSDLRSVADFVGAVRMPTGMFHSEGTDVVADIVVLRKNTTGHRFGWMPGQETGEHGSMYSTFRRLRFSSDDSAPTPRVSTYWQDHPSHVAGEITTTGNYRNPIAVVTDDAGADFARAVDALGAAVAQLPMFDRRDDDAAVVEAVAVADPEGRKEGSYHLVDDVLMVVTDGTLSPVARAGTELRALVSLKALALELLETETAPGVDERALEQLRESTRSAYDAYVARWGALNRGTLHEGKVDPDTGMPALSWRRPTLGGFRNDPDYLAVMALEVFDQDTNTARPATILLRRIHLPPEPVTSADSPEAAVLVSMGERGYVDLGRVAGLLGLDGEAEAEETLGDLVYRDPEAGGTVTDARSYLSGNVHRKLIAARAAAEGNSVYQANVAALEAARPLDLGPTDIRMYLGNPCVTPKDIEMFLREVVDLGSSVDHDPATASWECRSSGSSASASTVWGTPRLNAAELTHCALNGKAPVVYDVDSGGRKVRNPDESMAAQDKLTALQDRFSTWVWEDPERSERVCRVYNDRFNAFVPRVSDGSHLLFPGLSEEVTPHPWQRNIVDQIASTPATLCGHAVGAGKTLSMGLTAMTLRQFGLARKPLIVVPNHLLEQIARELQQAYPLGRFLIAGREDLVKEKRRLFVARCATGDWDAVIITHQGFTSIPVSPETERAWLQDQKDEYDDHLRGGAGGYFGAKQIARRLRSLESRLEALRGAADQDQVTFEQLGVDFLMVDEAHMFKRLPVASSSEGFSMGASKRATDLLLKSQWLRSRNEGRPHLALFTGTPWTNSLAETYVWQRFLQPEDLDTAGVSDFDAWAAVFVRRETIVEVAPDGAGFRVATRPTRMTNMVRLRTMLSQVADVLSADDLGLERPAKVVESIDAQRSPAQAAYIAGLVERAEKLRSGSNSTSADNMLAICGEGRRVALDPGLVGAPGESPKMERAAARVTEIYEAHQDTRYGDSPVPGALQIVFCDQGTPSKEKGGQTYGRMRDMLISRGVPAQSIRMIHEAKDDKARAALFAACRDGQVSVLLGSTEKLGMGTNIQTRLVAIHHLDAPWRPSDVDQREGRALRPGNLNPEVTIARYVTVRSFEAFMWQTLERKAVGFTAMYDRNSTAVEVDDISEVAPSYTTMKAMAAGSPLLMEQATLASTVGRLRTLRAVDRQSLVAATKRVRDLERRLSSTMTTVETLDTYLADVAKAKGPTSNLDDNLPQAVRALLIKARARHQQPRWSWSAYWRGLRLTSDSRSLGVTFEARLRAVGAVEVPMRKGSMDTATARTVEEIEAYYAGLPQRATWMRGHAEQLRTQIAEAQATIDGYVFPRAAELAEAEAALAAVERRIQAEADAPRSTEAGSEEVEPAAV